MTSMTDPDPHIGRTLAGQYRIDSLLGSGGMGRVYRGVQLSVNRPVAIRIISMKRIQPARANCVTAAPIAISLLWLH